MSNLPSLTPKKVIALLKKKGFLLVTKKRAVVVYHAEDMPKGTLREILKQADISFNS